MKKFVGFITVFACIIAFSSGAFAAGTATQTVSFSVASIVTMAVTGTPTLAITTASEGSEPNDATDATSTYRATTNGANTKISAKIDTAMPAGVTLKVNMGGDGTTGIQTLGTSDVVVVTGLSKRTQNNKSITYTLSALTEAGVVSSSSKTVTFTIADQ